MPGNVEPLCGRLIQHSPSSVYLELFGIEADLGEIPPRYNLAPSQPIGVARTAANGKRELTFLRWGLVPSWSKGLDSRFSLINARAETLEQNPPTGDPSATAAA